MGVTQMKKIMALAVATTMLMLVGCGSTAEPESSSKAEKTTSAATTEAETETTTEATEATTEESSTEPVAEGVSFADIEKSISNSMKAFEDMEFTDEESGYKICDGIVAEFEANGFEFGEYNDPEYPDSNGRNYSADTKTGGELIRSTSVSKMFDTPVALSDVEGLTFDTLSCCLMYDKNFGINDRYVVVHFNVEGDDLWAGHSVYSHLLTFFKENGYTDADNEATPLDEAIKFANEAYAPMSYNSLTCNLKSDCCSKIQFFPNSSELEIVFYK